MGLSLLEDDFAPSGTPIVALVSGHECGSTNMPSANGGFSGDHMFELHIMGVGERSGCARPGDQVTFTVGGIPAGESFSWLPFTEVQSLGQFMVVHLTALPDRAWYWMQTESADSLLDGGLVEALVDGNVCGETVIRTAKALGYYAPNGLGGFSRLTVPSQDIQPGCGHPGATVTFTVNGAIVGSTPVAARSARGAARPIERRREAPTDRIWRSRFH